MQSPIARKEFCSWKKSVWMCKVLFPIHFLLCAAVYVCVCTHNLKLLSAFWFLRQKLREREKEKDWEHHTVCGALAFILCSAHVESPRKEELYNFVLTDLQTHARTCISIRSVWERTYHTKEICTACDTNFQCSWIHNTTSHFRSVRV